MNLGIDTTYRSGDIKLNLGIERWLHGKTVGLRGGLGLGSRAYRNLFCGISINLKDSQIDYAFLFPLAGIEDTYGCHRLSFTYRLGRPPIDEIEPGSLEETLIALERKVKFLAVRVKEAEESEKDLQRILLEREKERLRELRQSFKSRRTTTQYKEKFSAKIPEKKELSEEMIIYRVQKGETLYSISKKYGVTVEVMRRLNKLDKDFLIQPGQRLRLK